MQRQSVRNLPTDKNPTGTRCITLEIPDDDEWERDAFSELERLGIWALWERDPTKSGKPVAKRWRQALSTWAHCDGTPTPVDGVEWEDDMAICESLRWHEGALQGYCCGEWIDIPSDGSAPIPGSGGQSDSGSRPAPGESKCYPVQLTARGTWLLPFGVQDGDIITVSNRAGAWSNDGVRWTCSDGTPFALGICSGLRYHDGGDPDGTLYHGQLSMLVGGQTLSATDGPVTLSGLSGQQQLVFSPNFDPIALAGGDIQFTVCVQNGTTPDDDWCFVMQLPFTNGGLTTVTSYIAGAPGQWIPGTGWQSDNCEYDASNWYRSLDLNLHFASTRLTQVDVLFDLSGVSTDHGPSNNQRGMGFGNSGAHGSTSFGDAVDGTDQHMLWNGDSVETDINFLCIASYYGTEIYTGNALFKSITFRGKGTCPFGTPNC